MKKLIWLTVLWVLAIGFTCQSGFAADDGPRYGGTFTWNHNGGIPKIGTAADNLMFSGNRNSYPALEPLLITDSQENLQPWLAESWVISPDGKQITLNLRKGIKFHDGTDFNAEAVKANLESVYKANIPGSAALGKIISYDILDPHTLRLNLEQYDFTLLLRLAQASTAIGLMASAAAIAKETTPDNAAELRCVGTGPFVFDSWKRDAWVKYKRWDGYWQKGKPYLDAVKVQNISDLTVSIMSFKAGEAQAIENIDPVDARQLEKEGYQIYQPDLYFLHTILTDGANPNSPFAKKEVRLALEYAIDKRTMAQGIGMGYYEPLSQLAVSHYPWFNPDLKLRAYDPKKAKQLLAQAGYPNGFKTKLVSDVMARRDTLIAVQTYLEEVGITTELEILEFGAAFAKPRQGWEGIYFPGYPNVGTMVGIIDRFGDPDNYISFYRPPGWQEKWNAMRAELDDAKRMEKFKEILKILYDEVAAMPYQGDAPLMVIQPGKVHGFKHHANHIVGYWAPQDVWLSK